MNLNPNTKLGHMRRIIDRLHQTGRHVAIPVGDFIHKAALNACILDGWVQVTSVPVGYYRVGRNSPAHRPRIRYRQCAWLTDKGWNIPQVST